MDVRPVYASHAAESLRPRELITHALIMVRGLGSWDAFKGPYSTLLGKVTVLCRVCVCM